jgi:hypothetical protein
MAKDEIRKIVRKALVELQKKQEAEKMVRKTIKSILFEVFIKDSDLNSVADDLIDNIQNSIDSTIETCEYFKIGKTGDDPEERYKNEEEYRNHYDDIKTLATHEDKETINQLEAYFIEKHQNDESFHKNKNKNKGSGGIMTDKLERYSLYIVFKNKS